MYGATNGNLGAPIRVTAHLLQQGYDTFLSVHLIGLWKRFVIEIGQVLERGARQKDLQCNLTLRICMQHKHLCSLVPPRIFCANRNRFTSLIANWLETEMLNVLQEKCIPPCDLWNSKNNRPNSWSRIFSSRISCLPPFLTTESMRPCSITPPQELYLYHSKVSPSCSGSPEESR